MAASFQEIATQWKNDKRQWVKPSSYATYVQLTNSHLLPFFSGKEPLQEAVIQQYVNEKLAAGLSIKTIRDTLVVLKMIIRYAERSGAWPHLEWQVRFPSSAERRREIPILSVREQKRLLEYLRTHFSFRNLGLIICFQSGIRIGEVCGLQWKDLDVESGVIHVTKTVQRICLADGDEHESHLSIGAPKTVSSIRDIPLSQELRRLIRPLRKVMPAEAYVVTNAEQPLEPRYYRDYFRKVLRQLDIPPIRFHALRHSFATRCIQSRCDYKTVSAILGHASLATTMDLYVHPNLEDKRRCIERMTKGL